VVFVENGGHGNLAAAPLAKLLFEARYAPKPPAPVQAASPKPRLQTVSSRDPR